jgi:transketolase
MKPAVRMAALMGVPVKFIWSHDSFRVGEDGPTHEPIEQEAQIRLMEKVHNHKGQPSLLALRPADTYETVTCWKLALENTQTPTAIILTRQNIVDLPAGTDYSQVSKGGYVVCSDEKPQIVLVASGSEVSTLAQAGELLKKDGIQFRLVSVPSEGLFRSQSKDYQTSVLPTGIKRFGLTAGLPVNLEGLVGENGKVFGVSTFGFSAPYKVLDEKLGFTPEQVYAQIVALLK